MTRHAARKIFLFGTIALSSQWTLAQATKVVLDQALVQTATITSPAQLSFFIDDFMISEKQVTKLMVFDLNGDGFGEGDLARTFPSGKVYTIAPSKKAQAIMNDWSMGGNVRFTADFKDSPEQFENAPDSVRAQGGIFAALLRGVRRNYKGLPLKLYLEQNGDVTAVEMWGYDPRLMKYVPPPVMSKPVDVPVMKLIYLEKTVVDSVFAGSR
ncbi:MAG: hypothetical protein ONB44_13040 [candidate division KSB1 bacterium]|nr:hypothetical protein [candidate division KSB1 bacterium]MDZ7303046.1 hypothetical protein [candidate division KSB1 bacterium]MDZ7312446.1 hypothetical protein [candidate division KSB1 bacterium]